MPLTTVLDPSFDEDRARNRKDHGPENLAVLRKLALNVLRAAKTTTPSALDELPTSASCRPAVEHAGTPLFRIKMVMNRQRKQKGRSHLGPALFARSQGPERNPAVSRETTVKSVSNIGSGFSSFA